MLNTPVISFYQLAVAAKLHYQLRSYRTIHKGKQYDVTSKLSKCMAYHPGYIQSWPDPSPTYTLPHPQGPCSCPVDTKTRAHMSGNNVQTVSIAHAARMLFYIAQRMRMLLFEQLSFCLLVYDARFEDRSRGQSGR